MPANNEPFELIGAAHWASYLINGDTSGLEPHELEVCNAWLSRELEGNRRRIVDVKRNEYGDSEDPWFTWNYSLFTGDEPLGGEVLTYIAI